MIRYVVPTTGTYRAVVFQYDTMNSSVNGEWISLSYTIYVSGVGHVHCYEGDCIPNNVSTHKVMCYCGIAYIEEDHNWISYGTNAIKCLDCMYVYSGSVPGGTIQSIGNSGE